MQRRTVSVLSILLKLQTISCLEEKFRSLLEELFILKGDEDRLTAGNKVVLFLRTQILNFKRMTGSLAGFFQEVKAPAVETEWQKKAYRLPLYGVLIMRP